MWLVIYWSHLRRDQPSRPPSYLAQIPKAIMTPRGLRNYYGVISIGWLYARQFGDDDRVANENGHAGGHV